MPAVLKKHADEVARRRNVAAMGGDPAPPATMLQIKPITGNDVFGSRARATAPTVIPPIVDESASHSDTFTPSPSPVTPPPHFIPSHSVGDNDFLPDPVEHVHDPPPEGPSFPDHEYYPSMEMSDADALEDEGEGEGEDGVQDDEPDLESFMDWEYLKEGKCYLADCRCRDRG